MLTKTEVLEIVTKKLQQMSASTDLFVLVEKSTIEKPFGWVFFYNAKRFVETGESRYRLAGNGPVIVNKQNGSVEFFGSAKPPQEIVAECEQKLAGGKKDMTRFGSLLPRLLVLWLWPILTVFVSSPTFAYDFHQWKTGDYDETIKFVSGFDVDAVLTTTQSAKQSDGARTLYVNFPKFLVAEGGSVAWNPFNGPGPLAADMAATFRGGSYTETVLGEDTTIYRAYGGNSQQIGPFWTQTPPSGPLQSTIDSAMNPAWGNTAQNVSTIRVPSGTTIYTGFAALQGGLVGGGSQFVIPTVNPGWLVK